MKWLEIAWQQVGIQETSGADATPEIVAYFRDAGRPEVTSDEVAWCAAFAGACLARAGLPQTIAPEKALLARSYLEIGRAIDAPRMGAIAVLSRGSNPAHGHVGFVVGWTDTHLVLLGGNQSNRVCTQHFPRARLLPGGLRWPGEAGDLSNSRIAAAAARQKKDAAKATAPQVLPAPPAPAAPPPEFPADAALAKGSALQAGVEQLIGLTAFARDRWPWIVAAVTVYYGARMAWDAWRIKGWRAEDAATGKTQSEG